MRLSRDAGILVALVAVLGIGLLIVISRDQPVGPPFRLEGHGPSGLSGLGAGLNAAGYDVRSGRRPVMPREGLTITVNPQGFSIDEAGRWTETVRAGGTLLLATDRNGPLTDALGLLVARGENVTVDTPASSRAFPGIGTPTGPVAATFTGVPDGAQALWTSNGRDVMVVFPLGRGSVWAISDPRWLTNEGVREMGLPVALPLAERAHGAVTVDEYHHGVGESAGSFGYLPGWLQLVVLQLLIALVAAMVTAARRLGPVHPVREPPTRSTAELAGSLARMHRKAGRLEAATRPLAAELRRRPGGTSAAVAAGLERLEAARGEREAVEALAEIEQATRRLTGANR